MKILHIVAYYPPHVGGMEQRVKELATFQAKQGLDVSVFTSSIGHKPGDFNQNGVKVTYSKFFEFARTPITLKLMRSIWQSKNIDVIHLHVAQAFFPELVAILAKIRRIPYIAHVRCIIIPSGLFGRIFLPFYNRFILACVYRGAAKVIVLTQDFVEILHHDYGVSLKNIDVIPNATSYIQNSKPRQALHQPIRLLAVGRISVQKNYTFMLRVIQYLKKSNKGDFTLSIVGPGDKIDALRQESKKLGISDNVSIVGAKHQSSLESIYENSDILLHCSLLEGFGTVFIEAMAKALPIVASDVVGTRNVVKNGINGILAPLDVEAMALAVLRLAQNIHLYKKISSNNLNEIKNYKWETIVERTNKIYENCIKH